MFFQNTHHTFLQGNAAGREVQTDRHAVLPFDLTDIMIGILHVRRPLAAIYEIAYGFIRKSMLHTLLFS